MSIPVQAIVHLEHDAGGDVCESEITESLRFDLTAMGEAYTAGTARHGSFWIRVHVFQEPSPKRPFSGKLLSKSQRLKNGFSRIGDPSPESLNKVHGAMYEF